MSEVTNPEPTGQKKQENQKQIVSKSSVDDAVQDKESKPSPNKKDSPISNLISQMKSFSNQKPKHNPLLIEEDIQQENSILDPSLLSPPLQPSSSSFRDSIINLPESIKESALDITTVQSNKIEQVFEEIKPQIIVDIVQAAQKSNTISKSITYTIKGEDMHGQFIIKRKYTEFLSLRKIIAQRWPGSFIPGLKNKFDMKNQDEKQILVSKVLVSFLLGLSYSKHIYYKEEVQLFLRSPDIDITEMFQQMPDLKVADLISRFEYAFGEELEQIQGPKFTQTLTKFHKKLRKIIPTLQEVTTKALNLAESYDTYVKNLARFGQAIRFYEHFSLAEFTQNSRDMTLLVKDDQKRIDHIKQILLVNPFYQLFTLFEIQLIDAKAFLDTMIAIGLYDLRKDELEKQIIQNQGKKQSIDSGNRTIKSMTTRKHKEDLSKQLEMKLKKLHQQKEEAVKIFQIVEKITAKKIIPIYKGIKKNNYFLAIGKWIGIVNKEIPELETIWNFISMEAQETKQNALQNQSE